MDNSHLRQNLWQRARTIATSQNCVKPFSLPHDNAWGASSLQGLWSQRSHRARKHRSIRFASLVRDCSASRRKRLTLQRQSVRIIFMIKEQIQRLTSTLQALTLQRINATRKGRLGEAEQIRSVQVDIDNKIQELEKQLAWNTSFLKPSCVASIMLDILINAIGFASIFGV